MYTHLKRINLSYSNLYKREKKRSVECFEKNKDTGIMVCSSYNFAVGRLANEYFVTDTHGIDNCIGRNGNGIFI